VTSVEAVQSLIPPSPFILYRDPGFLETVMDVYFLFAPSFFREIKLPIHSIISKCSNKYNH
jgi:hypothetical protein